MVRVIRKCLQTPPPTAPTKKTCRCRPSKRLGKGFEPSTFCMASRTCGEGDCLEVRARSTSTTPRPSKPAGRGRTQCRGANVKAGGPRLTGALLLRAAEGSGARSSAQRSGPGDRRNFAAMKQAGVDRQLALADTGVWRCRRRTWIRRGPSTRESPRPSVLVTPFTRANPATGRLRPPRVGASSDDRPATT
jgi:hypothetical protein